MTDQLYETYGDRIDEVVLTSADGGLFEVEVDGTLVYSKKETRRHATFDEVRDAIEAL